MVRKKLGRGLQSLLGIEEDELSVTVDPEESGAHDDLDRLPIDQVDRNPQQPRQDFDPSELEQLAASIRTHGVIQPIVVRPKDGRYQLVAGERRLRAAQQAGLVQIPARVVEIDDRQASELALVENLQRQDLNPVEKAKAFESYLSTYAATHEQLAEQLGVDRSTVTNLVRLLELPEPIQEMLRAGKLTNGHARTLLSVGDPVEQIAMSKKIIAENLSVRQVEVLTQPHRKPRGSAGSPAPAHMTTHVQALQEDLCRRLGVKVEIKPTGKDKGSIIIGFTSNDEFERLIAYFTKE